MTELVDIEGGRIAYDVTGEGPLIVLMPGIGDIRQTYRHLAPLLAGAGYRVATADLRGHGESTVGDWTSISRTDAAGDFIALARHLGGPAVLVGNSLAGGAATIAAATAPDLVSAIVEIDPFTRTQKFDVGALLTNRRYRRGTLALGATLMTRSLNRWIRYLDIAYPTKPADYDDYIKALRAKLSEPGRMAEFMKTGKTSPADADAQLPNVRCPALIVMGTEDPDFPDPRAEAEAIVAAMPAGLGSVAMIDGAGHYPHAQSPGQVAEAITSFLKARLCREQACAVTTWWQPPPNWPTRSASAS